MDFQFNRKTASDLPRRPVSQRHGQRLTSRDLFSAEPSLSPQDGPKIVNEKPLRQRLGRAGANEFTAGQRGSGAASQVQYSSSATSKNQKKAATREELIRRRAALQERLATQNSGTSTASKIPGRIPGGVGARPSASTPASPMIRKAPKATTASRTTARKTRTTTVRPKSRAALKREEILMKGLWIFFGVLLLRLIFMENGVIDYYKMETELEYKNGVYGSLIQENKDLVQEIKMIKTSPRYQKKLAREHLGVIDQNEFLILFAEQKPSKTK